MSDTIIKDVSTVILCYLWFIMENYLLSRRWKLSVSLALYTVCIALYYFVSHSFPEMTIIRTLAGMLPICLPVIVLYKDKLVKKLTVFFVIFTTLFASELISAAVFTTTDNWMPESYEISWQYQSYSFYLFLNALLMSIVSHFLGKYYRKDAGQTPLKWQLGFLLLPFSQCVILAGVVPVLNLYTNSGYVSVWLVITAVLSVTADLALVRLMTAVSKSARIEAENRLLLEQADAQSKYYSALSEQYEKVSHMRHDIQNHLYTIKILLEDGKTDEAREYAADVRAKSEFSSDLGRCLNPVVDSFLFGRIEQLKGKGIEVSADVSLPHDMGIENSDLISAFGNLLDNAEEACLKTEKRFIAIKAHIKSGYLIISVENSFLPSDRAEKKRRIPELSRGLGSHILTELAESYDGEFSTEQSGGVYRAALTLKEQGSYD